MAEQYPFLSNDWMDAAKRIRDEMPHPEVPSVGLMKMNLVVTASPFEGGDIKAHVDTSDGEIIVEHGHLDGPDLTVTVEYDVAKALFVDLDVTAAMQAFMAGKVKVQGDITKLMALGAPGAAGRARREGRGHRQGHPRHHRVVAPAPTCADAPELPRAVVGGSGGAAAGSAWRVRRTKPAATAAARATPQPT